MPEAAQIEHRMMFESIAAGHPAQARQCAYQHLRNAAARVGIELANDLGVDCTSAIFAQSTAKNQNNSAVSVATLSIHPHFPQPQV